MNARREGMDGRHLVDFLSQASLRQVPRRPLSSGYSVLYTVLHVFSINSHNDLTRQVLLVSLY